MAKTTDALNRHCKTDGLVKRDTLTNNEGESNRTSQGCCTAYKGYGKTPHPYERRDSLNRHYRAIVKHDTATNEEDLELTPNESCVTLKQAELDNAISVGISAALKSLNLDNFILENTAISSSRKDENDMARKRIRREIEIDGQKVWISGDTEQEYVENYMAKLENIRNKNGTASRPINRPLCPTFQVYGEQYMTRYKRKNQVRHTTLAGYESSLNNHLYPFFGNMCLDEITIDIVQDFLNEKHDYAVKTIKEMRMALSFILDAAVEDRIIDLNPAKSKRLRIRGKEPEKREALTSDELNDIIAQIPNLQQIKDRRFLAFLCYMPVRREDVLGIQMKDIDKDHQLIHIRQGVTFALHPFTDADTGKSYKAGSPVIGAPKTEAGARIIPIVPQLWELLELTEEELADKERFLFSSRSSVYLPYTQETMRCSWKRIKKTVNLYGKTAHCFRHTFATLGQRNNISSKTMQVIGGWSDAKTLNKVYTHTQEEDIEIARQRMTQMYAS